MAEPTIHESDIKPERPKAPWQAIFFFTIALALIIVKFGKFIVAGLKILKLGPFLKMGTTMLLSIWFYQLLFGWLFSVGFVFSILVHEIGHVYVAWRQGIPVTAPVFIPGMGAFILQKRAPKSAWVEALIGIGGPLAGTLCGLVFLAFAEATGSQLMLALAYTTFFLNLFNLTPVMPLDGGWITGAISPYIWLVGIILMGGLFFTGYIANPFIIFVLLLGLPRLWHGLRHGTVAREGLEDATRTQKLQMGLAYVALCGLLASLMAYTHFVPENQPESLPIFDTDSA